MFRTQYILLNYSSDDIVGGVFLCIKTSLFVERKSNNSKRMVGMYNTILQYRDRIELSNSWISIYQKVYKWVEDGSMSEKEFESLEYKPTREYQMFLHNNEQSFDNEYDFRLIVDKWQLDYITNLLQVHLDLKYDQIRDWFAKLSNEVHSFYATTVGLFGRHLAYHGTRTTELMKQYHVFNKEDPFK